MQRSFLDNLFKNSEVYENKNYIDVFDLFKILLNLSPHPRLNYLSKTLYPEFLSAPYFNKGNISLLF